ncbi:MULTISPECIES: hypothetical protein [Nitrosomonas]|nr:MULTISPECIES: hypothetical protein [Nitrosomonas]UVS62515.1 hypothetical protein NX761_05165 [Nitrosomonas sp. PLL12]
MTLAQVRIYSKAIQQMEADRLKAQAIAVRAALADEKSFKKWFNSF